MASLLVIVGALWAIIGVANIFGMPWSTTAPGSPLITYGLVFNILLFVFPGLILIGIGEMVRKKAAPEKPKRICD